MWIKRGDKKYPGGHKVNRPDQCRSFGTNVEDPKTAEDKVKPYPPKGKGEDVIPQDGEASRDTAELSWDVPGESAGRGFNSDCLPPTYLF